MIEYPDMPTQTDIQHLLEKLYVFSPERRREILAMFSAAPDGARTELVATLRQAIVRQDILLGERVIKDPQFPEKLEAFSKQTLRELSPVAERVERAETDRKITSVDPPIA